MNNKECPYCHKKALREEGKRYHFDVKAWITRQYSLYRCAWCKRYCEYSDDE